jgi:hypothetical protein
VTNAGRFPQPWTAHRIEGGYVVGDANGQALAYVYARDDDTIARQAGVLTMDEARRICDQHRQAAGSAPRSRAERQATTPD